MGKDLRGKQLGNGIYQRKDGRYIGRFVNRFGKREEIGDRNLKQLKNKLDKNIYNDKMCLNVIDTSITLNQWFDKWLSIHKYKVIRETSKQTYIQVYKKHISPVFGKRKLNEITNLQIKELLKNLDKNDYKFETKNKVRILLLDMFDKAMIDDIVPKNPARGIKIVRDEDKDIKVLTTEEQSIFFECCKGTFYDNLFIVAVTTGLRPGEIYALTWDDINLDNKEIVVSKTLIYGKLDGDTQKTFHINPPKTKSSYRNVPISKQCMLALRKQKIQKDIIMSKVSTKKGHEFENLLFTTRYGTPINAQIYYDAIKKIIKEINLVRDLLDEFELFSGHCFRHTFATRCFESNIQAKTVQGYLGHASLSMTMDLYTHVLDDKKHIDMKKLENTLDSIFNMDDEISEQRCDVYEKKNDKIRYLKTT